MNAAVLLDPAGHPIIGHRGASGLAPENTVASFDLAIEQGAEAVEFDIRLTADGEAVVFHDPTLDRTTDQTGPIAALPLAALAGVDAGARFTPDGSAFPFRGQEVRIPTLREVLARYPDLPMLIELKVAEAVPVVRQELIRAGAERRVVVASFLSGVVHEFMAPPFQAGASRREITSLAVRAALSLPAGNDGVLLYAVPARWKGWLPVPTRRFTAAARQAGKPVHVWTVNDAAQAHALWDRGAAGMITNFPGRLLEARNRRFG
jgi:glycerophosphoryl diester phosphodiesterase